MQYGLARARVQIALPPMLVPADDVLAVRQLGLGGGNRLSPLPQLLATAQSPAARQPPRDGGLAPVVDAAEILMTVDCVRRLLEHPLVHRVQAFGAGRLGHDVGVVIQVDGLEAARQIGHLIALDHPLEAEVGAGPVMREHLFVRLRGIHLEVLALGNAHGPDVREGGLRLADRGAAAVDIAQPGLVSHGHGFIGRIAVAGPEHHIALLAGRRQLLVDVIGRAGDVAGGAEGVVGQRQVIAVGVGLAGLAQAVGLARFHPVERVRPGVAAHLDPGQGVHAFGPFLRDIGQLGVEALVTDLADDDRGQGRHLVLFQKVGDQHFAGQR